MKSFKHFLLLLSIIFMVSCTTDMDDISTSTAEVIQLNNLIKESDWKISGFTYNENDLTANYEDYVFSFEENNQLTATTGTDTESGSWRINNDAGSEFDPYNDLDFILFFTPDSKLSQLAAAYDVIAASSREIILNLEANPNGNTAVLVFSRI